MELSACHRAGAGAGRGEDPDVEAETLAGVKKKAKNEGRTIVFIDQSGLSQRPHRCRTWAPSKDYNSTLCRTDFWSLCSLPQESSSP